MNQKTQMELHQEVLRDREKMSWKKKPWRELAKYLPRFWERSLVSRRQNNSSSSERPART